jgi:hypothetical protein
MTGRWAGAPWTTVRWDGQSAAAAVAVYNDFLAAVIAQLRSYDSGAVPAALGEDTSIPGGTKIWADSAAYGQPAAPYLTYSEPECPLSPESADDSGVIHYYGKGTLTFTLTDISKVNCRNTAYLIVQALNDADDQPTFLFQNGYCLELRHSNPRAPIVTVNEPNAPATYQRVLEFEYVIAAYFTVAAGLPGTSPPTVYNDLMAAVVAQLRTWNEGAVPMALGEDTEVPGGTKIWADDAAYGQPDAPYLLYSEDAEPLSPESADAEGVINYYGKGTLTFTLTDVSKVNCRNTAYLIVSALNDADNNAGFIFADGYSLELRHSNPMAPIVTVNEPNSPATYQRTLEFEYVVNAVF